MTGWIIAAAALLLVAVTVLAALSLALVQASESALERELEERGRLQRGRWLLGRMLQVEWAVSFARTALRIAFATLVLAAFAGFEEPLTPGRLAIAWAVAVALLWAFSSTLAGAVARHAPEATIARFLLALRILDVVLGPVRLLARGVDTAVGSSLGAPDAVGRREEELASAIEDTQRHGGLDAQSAEILENAIEFGDTTVGAVMTPRQRIEGVELTDDLASIRDFALRSGHSRIPVWQGSVDHVAGILYVKDLVRFLANGAERFELRPLLREPMRVPESKPLREQLRDFQHAKVHFAVVLDEFGGTAGIITIEDVLEELVGEIRDEHEPVSDAAPGAWRVGEGEWEASGAVSVFELNTLLGASFPEDAGFETLAGFMLDRLGSIPRAGAVLDEAGFRFEVLQATPRAVQRVRIVRLPG